MTPPVKPEVMSPAGYWPQLRAAIDAGADAVYFGLKHFSARAKVGFSLEELPEALRTLHARGVKGFVTFNTLVFDHEVREAIRVLEEIANAGADAIIVQDLGIAKLALEAAPALEVHGSTQMSITSAEGVRFAQRLGVRRVVMARELSLADIRAIRSQTDCELEMFVHGALCVSYSGQCFSSEAWGGRSANRGQCAQACRLPYELMVDGILRPLGGARYLLSPGDLYALHQVPEIVSIGISSLKIEGRYKDADYVALTTQAYRRAVDDAWAGRQLSVTPLEETRLEQIYSRGLGAFFVSGTNHQSVVQGRAPRHRGLLMGRVECVLAGAVVIAPTQVHGLVPLKPGDGVVFDSADWRSPQEPEEGGRVFAVTSQPSGKLELRFGNRAVDFGRIRAGDLLWRTSDPDLGKAVRALPVQRQVVVVKAIAREGAPLETEWRLRDRPGVAITASSPPLERAGQLTLTHQMLVDQLGRLGGTPYVLGEVELSSEGAPFAPVSILNRLRREAVQALTGLQTRQRQIAVRPVALDAPLPQPAATIAPQLHLLVRTPEQLEAAITARPASITLDYLELYGLRPSVDRVRESGIEARVASPRVLKPAEERIVHFLLKLGCPILVRSAGLLDSLRQTDHPALFGDFSLNAANAVTARLLLELGLTRLTPTHDLNAAQVASLAAAVDPLALEPIAYHHLPVFHTEHCVFCRFLSKGSSHLDCGHPCEKHRLALRDERGNPHPVMADVGCRNTVFGAEAQQASAHLGAWLAAGLRHFRLEFVHETPEQVRRVTRAFREALSGQRTPDDLAQEIKRIAPAGATEGSLFVPKGYADLPILQ